MHIVHSYAGHPIILKNEVGLATLLQTSVMAVVEFISFWQNSIDLYIKKNFL